MSYSRSWVLFSADSAFIFTDCQQALYGFQAVQLLFFAAFILLKNSKRCMLSG